jgi:hypothetical protein
MALTFSKKPAFLSVNNLWKGIILEDFQFCEPFFRANPDKKREDRISRGATLQDLRLYLSRGI